MTDKEIAQILNDIVIVCDTREKKNDHIVDYMYNNGIKVKHESLTSGDYSFILPNHPELGLDKSILIERKNSLDEISQNFTKNRKRFVNEFERIDESQTIHLIIETATWKKLLNGSYRSKLEPKSLLASILTWNVRYDTNVWFCNKPESGVLIHNIIYYGLREKLKNIQQCS